MLLLARGVVSPPKYRSVVTFPLLSGSNATTTSFRGVAPVTSRFQFRKPVVGLKQKSVSALVLFALTVDILKRFNSHGSVAMGRLFAGLLVQSDALTVTADF